MASKQSKVIVSCAVTGSIHTPTMSEYLPITSAEIAESGIEAHAAGAAILHLHARDVVDGKPTASPEAFMNFLPEIKSRTDAVVNITTGGAQWMSLEDRLAAARRASPEMCSLNMGSMNFALYPMLEKYKEFKYGWEAPYLEASRDGIFKNTFKDIQYILQELGDGHGTRFEFECYDIGHLYSLAHFLDRKLVKPPLFVQTVFGILGGIGADIENLNHARHIANKLFGDNYEWSVMAAGRSQMPFATAAAISGGNLRVGLEDSIYIGKGKLAPTNASQVTKVRRILEELGLEVATSDEARARLGLKGSNEVKF